MEKGLSNILQRELLFDDPQTSNLFYKILDERIAIQLKALKFDRTYSATVMAVGSGTADIKLQGGTNIIPEVLDKTGEVLSVGNEVLIEAINNSLNNIVIKYKK